MIQNSASVFYCGERGRKKEREEKREEKIEIEIDRERERKRRAEKIFFREINLFIWQK